MERILLVQISTFTYHRILIYKLRITFCKIANHASRYDFQSHVSRLIWSQSHVKLLIFGDHTSLPSWVSRQCLVSILLFLLVKSGTALTLCANVFILEDSCRIKSLSATERFWWKHTVAHNRHGNSVKNTIGAWLKSIYRENEMPIKFVIYKEQ